MITNIYGTGPYITVSSPTNVPYISPGAASAGLVRYHNNQTQVYDGNAWLALGGVSSVGLTPRADEAISWVLKKMAQEAATQVLAQKHPAVADALDAVRLAEQQLQTVVALCDIK